MHASWWGWKGLNLGSRLGWGQFTDTCRARSTGKQLLLGMDALGVSSLQSQPQIESVKELWIKYSWWSHVTAGLKKEDMLCDQRCHQGNTVAFALMNSPRSRVWNSAFIEETWLIQATKTGCLSGKQQGRGVHCVQPPLKYIYTRVQIYNEKYKSTGIFLLVWPTPFFSVSRSTQEVEL